VLTSCVPGCTDITFCDEDLLVALKDLSAAVEDLESCDKAERRANVAKCDDVSRKIVSLKKGYSLEIRQLEKADQKLYMAVSDPLADILLYH
jgi:hypothetical protein